MCGASPIDDDGRDASTRRRLEGGLPAPVDLDQIHQRANDPVDVAQQLATTGALEVRQRTLQRLGAGGAAVARLFGLVGCGLGHFGLAYCCLELGGPRREVGVEDFSGLLELAGGGDQQVGADCRRGGPLLERRHSCDQRVEILLFAHGGPRGLLGAGPHADDGLIGRLAAEHVGPALAQGRLFVGQRGLCEGQLLAFGRAPRRLFGLGDGQLGGQARGFSLQRGHHVDIGCRVERRHHTPSALAQDPRETAGALDQTLHPAEGVGQVFLPARRQLGGRARGLGVELLERLVQLALLVATHGQAGGGRPSAGHQVGQLRAGQVAADREQLAGDGIV